MTLKLVHHSQTRPITSPDNEGFDLEEIRAILQQLEESGVSSEIVDVMTKSDEERTDLYLEATIPTARKKYQVRQVFGSKRHAGYLFGREVPALLVYEPGKQSPGEWYCGGLWVLEVDSREEAVGLIEQDPYFRLGLRKGYRLLVWGKAPCYETVSL